MTKRSFNLRQFKLLALTQSECLEAFGKFLHMYPKGSRNKYQEYKVKISKPLDMPDDAAPGAIYSDPQSQSFLMVMYHESFPEVPAGEEAEIINSALGEAEYLMYRINEGEKTDDEIHKEGYDQGVVDGAIAERKRIDAAKDPDSG